MDSAGERCEPTFDDALNKEKKLGIEAQWVNANEFKKDSKTYARPGQNGQRKVRKCSC